MNRFVSLALSCLSILAADGAAAEPPVAAPPPTLRTVQLLESGQPVRIVCFGDSVTGVYYHTGGRRAWCDLVGLALQRLFPGAHVEMINAGVSGNNTTHALARMETDVLQHNPQLVFVMFGLNDVVSVTPEGFRANLGQIVQRAQQHGTEVILMTPNAVSPGDAARLPDKVAVYAQITRELGRELHVPVADPHEAFRSVQVSDTATWSRLMSDAIHPNMRGHKLLAAEAVKTLTGRPAPLTDLPRLQPGLPRLRSRLEAREPIRIVAMKPYDTLIGPVLSKLYPDARIEVTPWDATGKTVAEIELQARSVGWLNYRAHPDLLTPDLFIVAVPAEAASTSDAQFVHDYTWIINWSLSFGPPGWNCLVILPSVARLDQDKSQQTSERRAIDVIQGQDVPYLQRKAGDRAPAAELLGKELAQLLAAPVK